MASSVRPENLTRHNQWIMMMDRQLPPLRLLSAFETVLRAGGVQNAAARLNVTQPAVSQALRSLEDHVGTLLLDRSKRPAALTEAGRILLHAVSGGLDQIESAIGRIRVLEQDGRNVVTIACTVCTGLYWLMPRLAAFYARHPEIVVQVVPTSGVPRFAAGTDLLIRYGAGDWPDGSCERLFDERLVPVCSPGIADRLGAGNFTDATLLHVETGEDLSPGWDDYFHETSLPHDRQGDISFDNHVQATQAALAGMGVMLGWIANTADLVREGRLVAFCDRSIIPGGAYYLISPPHGPNRHGPNRQGPGKPAAALLASHLKTG